MDCHVTESALESLTLLQQAQVISAQRGTNCSVGEGEGRGGERRAGRKNEIGTMQRGNAVSEVGGSLMWGCAKEKKK